MGVAIEQLTTLSDIGALVRGGRVLDIGAQNLVGITPRECIDFVMRHNPVYDIDDLRRYAETLSELSEMDAEYGGINGAWLGELLRRCGIEYMAFDIFDGADTVIVDLNRQTLVPHYHNWFDVCLNFGTTEHILNQFNCFEVMHDALKPGGYVYHALPVSGLFDHGYFSYNPDLFEALAIANEYRVIEMWIDTEASAVDYVGEYSRRYPIRRAPSADAAPVTPVTLQFIAQKMINAPFRAPLETRTTARDISRKFAALERSDDTDSAPLEQPDDGAADYDHRLAVLRERLLGGEEITTDEIIASARLSAEVNREFCLFLEESALQREVANDPGRHDLAAQLESVRGRIIARYPGYPYVRRLFAALPSVAVQRVGDAALEMRRALAYWRHCVFGTIAGYPLELELPLIERALSEPEDRLHGYYLRCRRAELLGNALRKRPIKLADGEADG